MGCGASKGNEEGGNSSKNEDIEFKDTGVASMDNFFSNAKGILEAFEELTEPLGD
jgi:hypothetical protein